VPALGKGGGGDGCTLYFDKIPMAIKKLTEKKLTWINIDRVNNESLKFLKNNYSFHHLDLEDIQSESQTPKIDTYKNYLFVVLQFPIWQNSTKRVISYELDMFIGENYVITIQHGNGKEIKNLFFKCLKNKTQKKEWMGKDSGYLLYNIIEALFQNSRPILNNIGKNINIVENDIFEKTPNGSIVRELGIHRRNALSFKSIIDPQRYLISNLSHIRKPFLGEDLTIYFDDINDYLIKLWSIVTSFKDTIDGLHVTLESLLTRKTNKVISTLTVLSASLLPLTLLAGIYGMNIPLPFSDNPKLVWIMFGGVLAIILLTIAIMKNKRWL